ncbi:uncharacterized protein LOC135120590 [Zophobas morio]|uniref:uncharacterized protein LOC135120590 n=1 Tax=Zophobas morio TaxID=2755281 RepID=UPI0030834A75
MTASQAASTKSSSPEEEMKVVLLGIFTELAAKDIKQELEIQGFLPPAVANYSDIAKNPVPLATAVLNAVKIMPRSYVLREKSQDVQTKIGRTDYKEISEIVL